jgi:hypothetical protein
MSLGEYERPKARDRLAFRIEDLPNDLAALLEGGLDNLWNPRAVAEDGDNLIG